MHRKDIAYTGEFCAYYGELLSLFGGEEEVVTTRPALHLTLTPTPTPTPSPTPTPTLTLTLILPNAWPDDRARPER